jgi:hypothetical protein
MKWATCPDQGVLRDHLDGSLSADDEGGILSHLDRCERCRLTLESLAAGSECWLAVARQVGEEPPIDVPRWDLGATTWTSSTSSQVELDARLFQWITRPDESGNLGRLDHYTLQEVIGHGSMGVVLKAFDEKLKRVVALKLLSPYWAQKPRARERFLREARVAAAIRDDYVVALYAVEESPDVPYLVMEFIGGGSLQDGLDRGESLSIAEIIRIGREIALGLAAAHAHGLVHRDIKPANILLEEHTRRVKIIDFGLARAADDASLTQDGIVVSTPQFMAPEQARGGTIDHRADLFSLGGVLYTLCTGKAPFAKGGTFAVLRSVADDLPEPPRSMNPDVPEWLDRVIKTLMAKEPAGRYRSAAEVAEMLDRQLIRPTQTTDELTAVRPFEPSKLPRGRRIVARPIIAAAALLAVAVLGAAEGSGITQLGATLIRICTREGVLSIAMDDPNVTVSIEGDSGVVITGAGPREVRLRAGNYRLSATHDGKVLTDELISIERGGKKIVTINREPAKPRAAVGLVRTFLGHSGRVWSVAFLPDGCRAVSCGDDGTIRLRDLEGERIVRQFQHGVRLSCVAVSINGRFALSAGRNTTIKVWDLQTGMEARPFEGQEAAVQSVAISRDGRFVVSGGDDKTVRYWDSATRPEKRCLPGHTDLVRSVAFLPDGRRAVSGGSDRTVRLWDLETGNELRQYLGYTDAVNAVAVSMGGHRLLSGGMDATIRLWDIDSEARVRDVFVPAFSGPLLFRLTAAGSWRAPEIGY